MSISSMSVAVFLRVPLCLLMPLVLSFPVIPQQAPGVPSLGTNHGADTPSKVDIPNGITWNSDSGNTALLKSSLQFSSDQSRNLPIPSYSNAASAAGDTHINIAHLTRGDTNDDQELSHEIHKTSHNIVKTLPTLTKAKIVGTHVSNFQAEHLQNNNNQGISDHSSLPQKTFVEYAIPANHAQSLQLAVDLGDTGEGHKGASQLVITIATSVAALFSVGVVIGIFGCCCQKQQQSDENENKNGKAAENSGGNIDKKPSQIFNPSDIPSGDKDLDETLTIKDKIKALDGKLLISPSPDHVPNKRKSQTDVILTDNKAQYTNNVNQPQILVSDEEDVQLRDKTKSKSFGDNISKSDTQDDISDKIFDNISTHSSISQPTNPDVVIAESDDDDEFAGMQRGTVILKSFQRAKPPRNRSPATRTSKGKIRKPRPNQDRSTDSPSQDKSKSREASRDREPASITSSLSLSPSQGTSSKTNSLDKGDKSAKKASLEKPETSVGGANISESPMTKSSDFSDFDSIMSQSVTSVSSDILSSKRHESPISARYKKSRDSPKSDRVDRVRTESPVPVLKSSEREVIDREQREDSPSRYKKSKDSPKTKQRHRRRERDREREFEVRNGKSKETSESTADNAAETNSAPNRLSGIPAAMNNNIFYLIDPTVKNKCKSAGDMTGNKRKSGDYSNRKSGDYSNRKSGDYSNRKSGDYSHRKSGDYSSRKSGDFSREAAKAAKHKVGTPDSPDGKADGESLSPTKKERPLSRHSRNSIDVQDTPL